MRLTQQNLEMDHADEVVVKSNRFECYNMHAEIHFVYFGVSAGHCCFSYLFLRATAYML